MHENRTVGWKLVLRLNFFAQFIDISLAVFLVVSLRAAFHGRRDHHLFVSCASFGRSFFRRCLSFLFISLRTKVKCFIRPNRHAYLFLLDYSGKTLLQIHL